MYTEKKEKIIDAFFLHYILLVHIFFTNTMVVGMSKLLGGVPDPELGGSWPNE